MALLSYHAWVPPPKIDVGDLDRGDCYGRVNRVLLLIEVCLSVAGVHHYDSILSVQLEFPARVVGDHHELCVAWHDMHLKVHHIEGEWFFMDVFAVNFFLQLLGSHEFSGRVYLPWKCPTKVEQRSAQL